MAAYLAETLYRKMRSDLEQRLILTDEKRLMTEPVLSKYYGVAVGTVRKAVSRLVEENVLERIQGSGTFLISSVNDKDLPHIYKQLVKEKSDSIEALFKGWEKDSLYYTLDQRQKDSIIISLDYIEAKDWLDMTRKETSEQ